MIARRARLLACLTLFALASAEPAYAQAVGGNIGTFIQNIIDLLNNNVIRGLAVIAIIITGIAWMFGHLDMRRAFNSWGSRRKAMAEHLCRFCVCCAPKSLILRG